MQILRLDNEQNLRTLINRHLVPSDGDGDKCASEAMQILRLIDFKIYKFQLGIALIQKPEADASGFYFTISNIILIIVC